MSITRTTAQDLRMDTEIALAAVAAKYGLEVQVKGGTYTSDSFKPKVEFTAPGSAERAFAASASLVGLSPDDYGAYFFCRGQLWKIVGINLRAHRYPIIAERESDEKRFKFSEQAVIDGLQRRRSVNALADLP